MILFPTIENLFSRTGIHPTEIDVLVVTCGNFAPSPSPSARIIHQFDMRGDVISFNLGGMGCSAGVIVLDLATRVLRNNKKCKKALVIASQIVSQEIYGGNHKSYLLVDAMFQPGCSAVILSNEENSISSSDIDDGEEEEEEDGKLSITPLQLFEVNTCVRHLEIGEEALTCVGIDEDDEGWQGTKFILIPLFVKFLRKMYHCELIKID